MTPDEAMNWVGVFAAAATFSALFVGAVIFLIFMWKDLINDR